MGKNNYFQFKQFKITQNQSAMKVGTDGILLGAWVNVANETTILDVGSGTGLIALMMAQRTSAKITGIEIEKKAANEASENGLNSSWKNQVEIKNISLQEFAKSTQEKFDLIISNPPFFNNGLKPTNINLSIAKHNDLLPLPDLINGCIKLLNSKGKLAVILPVAPAKLLIEFAESKGLFLNRLMKVKPNPAKESNRYLMEFIQVKMALKTESLTIYKEMGIHYSTPFKELTKNFYLNF